MKWSGNSGLRSLPNSFRAWHSGCWRESVLSRLHNWEVLAFLSLMVATTRRISSHSVAISGVSMDPSGTIL
jgi:hypothetical protein